MTNWIDFNEFKLLYQKSIVEEYPNKVQSSVPQPHVTVHIITYNHKPFIRQAIEGVLMQKVNFPIEVIIGDDDSSDGTREICIEYAQKYPQLIRLMLHKRENNIKVLGKACLIFQYLFNSFSARGRYIAVCSGDDYWTDPHKLQKQYEFLQVNPHINRTTTDHVITYTSSTATAHTDEKGEGAASTWMYKNIFTKIPIEYTQVIAEDSFLDFYLAATGDKAKTEKLEPVVIRRHDSNVFMTEDSKVMELQRINTIEKCVSAFSKIKSTDQYKIKLITKLIDKNRRKANLFNTSKAHFVLYFLKDIYRYKLIIKFFDYLIRYRILRKR